LKHLLEIHDIVVDHAVSGLLLLISFRFPFRSESNAQHRAVWIHAGTAKRRRN